MSSSNFVLRRFEHEHCCITLGPDIDSCTLTGDFCSLLINFANGLDPDQDQQNISPDRDPNDLAL